MPIDPFLDASQLLYFFEPQSRGTIRALKTILNSGGIKIERILHFLAQNHSFDLGNEDAEEEERRIVQRL